MHFFFSAALLNQLLPSWLTTGQWMDIVFSRPLHWSTMAIPVFLSHFGLSSVISLDGNAILWQITFPVHWRVISSFSYQLMVLNNRERPHINVQEPGCHVNFCELAAVQSEPCLPQSVSVFEVLLQNTALGKMEETGETQNQKRNVLLHVSPMLQASSYAES